jgi:hypothetical protein
LRRLKVYIGNGCQPHPAHTRHQILRVNFADASCANQSQLEFSFGHFTLDLTGFQTRMFG